jgi:3-hydroxybutyryl-CoA dehydratase
MTLFIGERASLSKTITDNDVRTFAELTLDYNPLHLDEEYAANTRFHRRIAHGMLSASLISAVLGNKLPGPGSVYLSQTLKFLAPVYLGDTVEAIVEVINIRPDKPIVTLSTTCINQRGETVLEGEAVVHIYP